MKNQTLTGASLLKDIYIPGENTRQKLQRLRKTARTGKSQNLVFHNFVPQSQNLHIWTESRLKTIIPFIYEIILTLFSLISTHI